MRPGIAFVISAPSGTGKSTLIRQLRNQVDGLEFSVSHTTRAPRPGEVDGQDYHFVDRPTFEQMVAEGAFAEWAEVHGNLYGTSVRALRSQLDCGRDVILDIDVQGTFQIAERVEGAVLVFVLPPSWAELRRRIETRGLDAAAVISRRLENARQELAHARDYHYLIVNDRLEGAASELASIVRAERCRTRSRAEALDRFVRAANSNQERPKE